jgi:hypothetical protein
MLRIELDGICLSALPLSYQWNKNGSPLTDATNAGLIFTPVEAAHAGSCTVLVNNQSTPS